MSDRRRPVMADGPHELGFKLRWAERVFREPAGSVR